MYARRTKGWGAVVTYALVAFAAGCIQEKRRLAADGDATGTNDATGTSDGTGGADATGEGDADGVFEIIDCQGCIIGDACRADGELDGQDPCNVCDPARSLSEWSLRSECDNLPGCVTAAVCNGSSCSYSIADGQCFIEMKCFANGALQDGDVCFACDPARDQTAWTSTRASCNDGDACTYEDVCDDGVCRGQTNDCSDTFDCTLDFCDGGRCVHQVLGNQCLVEGECFAAGASRSGDPCRTCRPLVSSSSLSLDVGLTCEDNDVCTETSTCDVTGTCSAQPTSIDEEPNGSALTAQDIGVATSGEFSETAVRGNIIGADLDVFRWGMVMLNTGAISAPRAEVRFDVPVGVELCLYARCGQMIGSSFAPTVQCGQMQGSALDDKTPGCCAVFEPGAEVSLELSSICAGQALVQGFGFASVRTVGEPDATTCGGYSLAWGATD